MERTILYNIEKSNNEKIVVSEGVYKNIKYIDIRVYYKADTDGEFLPSKKGVTVRRDLAEKFLRLRPKKGNKPSCKGR